MRLLLISLFCSLAAFGQRPSVYFTPKEVTQVKAALSKYPLLQQSLDDIKHSTDVYVGKDVDVPFPKDMAGGYTHNRHKENYMLMFNAGVLYQFTGNEAYAKLVKDMLLKYAVLNPTLKNHPQAKSNAPGHLFHQALNDANWMVYTGMAYDCIYNTLSAADRKKIEDGAFAPEVYFITHDLEEEFNLIHNHGTWACTGVGIIGLATKNEDYVQQALYGTHKDGKGGFMAQMSQLFAPDGYYTEGPYYARYALLPFYVFANALDNAKPELKIFSYRNDILKKALDACLQQTNTDGKFFPLNDALKEKDFTTAELVTAIDIAAKVYGADSGLLAVAKKQDAVSLTGGGAIVAAKLAGKVPDYYSYRSVAYTDGAKGDEGGLAILRAGKGQHLTSLVYKYSAHGLSHGHYDKLHFSLYDDGNEIFQDYGASRFVNVEQKAGGRYLPENKGYAMQTIAHNTLVVDSKSNFGGKEEASEKYHPEKIFSDLGGNVQAVSAKEEHAYDGVALQRTLYMIKLPESKKPLIVDLFKANATAQHQYDLPFHYLGQFINASFTYEPNTKKLEPLGNKNGYQYLWKEAEATKLKTPAQFTILNGNMYYSVSSLVDESDTIFFARSGANDPNFNLRSEPAYIIRKHGDNKTFLNVIELHGKFDPVSEFSVDSKPAVSNMQLLYDDANYTVVLVTIGNNKIRIAQVNNKTSETSHTVNASGETIKWSGNYKVDFLK
ncbi:MAG: alginate lyase family protein [Filimonas sp.]|nr:alginate lyase family protein [Filimonas sp.]